MKRSILTFVLTSAALMGGAAVHAREDHQHGTAMNMAPTDKPTVSPTFLASTSKPFAALMGDAMAVMEDGMRRASMNGQQEHDFVTMMIPHHQGAVDMAKALLLTTRDPAMRNMAQGILAEQQIEIQLMQQWLKQHPDTSNTSKGKK